MFKFTWLRAFTDFLKIHPLLWFGWHFVLAASALVVIGLVLGYPFALAFLGGTILAGVIVFAAAASVGFRTKP